MPSNAFSNSTDEYTVIFEIVCLKTFMASKLGIDKFFPLFLLLSLVYIIFFWEFLDFDVPIVLFLIPLLDLKIFKFL
jgi:hypothetical protein